MCREQNSSAQNLRTEGLPLDTRCACQTIDFLLPSSTPQKLDPICFYCSNKMAEQGLHLTALENSLGNGGAKGFTLNGMIYDEQQHGLFEFC